MGRASSAKKIQRVAKASGRGATSNKPRRNLAFPGVVAIVVVLGVALVSYGVISSDDTAEAGPALGDHWHAAVGVYVCDGFSDPLVDQNGDANGIHSHGDNVIHIHPSTSAATGEDATLGVFTEEVGIELGDGEFTMPNGDTFANGDDCNGEPGKVRVVVWESASDTSAGRTVYEDGFEDIHFDHDGMAFTIAFVPESSDVLPPPTSQNLAELGAIDGAGAPVPGDTSVPPVEGAEDPAASSTTAPAGEATTTTAAGG